MRLKTKFKYAFISITDIPYSATSFKYFLVEICRRRSELLRQGYEATGRWAGSASGVILGCF
jgi:hypothetical protein